MRHGPWVFVALPIFLFSLLVVLAAFGAEDEVTSLQPPPWLGVVKDWQLTSISLQPDGSGESFAHLLYRQDRDQKERNSAILTYQLFVDIGSPIAKVGKLMMALWLDGEGNRHRWINSELDQNDNRTTPPDQESQYWNCKPAGSRSD